MRRFGVRRRAVDAEKKKLDKIRKKLNKLDELTWRENRLSGFENHLYLVSASDFQSNPEAFEKKVTHLINESRQRTPMEQAVRLGYVGVPPIVSDLYTYLESLGGRVVFNEVQSQFAMLEQTDDIIEQYMIYTYPYDVFGRLADINAEIEERSINGIIHYVQSFCHHQIDGLLLQKEISVPVLTLECDRPGTLDLRNKLRLEAFVGMLKK
jgi:benzoyl-CoA reductase/2-hydroxyglutaryl-CoA dehydratase subunit BcrC/BadD/HgdB